MPYISLKKALLFGALAWLLSACTSAPPHDYSALLASKPRSIVVIPPRNNSVEVNASYTYLATISRPLAEKGYYVFPVAVIDMFLKENGLPTPADMNGVSLDRIRENIGADAVLYVDIINWGQKFQVLSSTAVVKANINLVDTQTGDLLWSARVEQNQSSSSNSSLLGAVVEAVVEQVRASFVDNTYPLAREANYIAINNDRAGLLDGPYRYESALDVDDPGPAAPDSN